LVGQALKSNTTLTQLALGWNSITAEGAKPLAAALHVNRRLEVLDLQSNKLDDLACEYFAPALEANSVVSSLDLHNNSITDAGCKNLCKALKTNETLTALYLDTTKITSSLLDELTEKLARNRKAQKIIRSSPDPVDTLPSSPSRTVRTVPSRRPIQYWELTEVAEWLQSLGLAKYIPLFKEHNITGPVLNSTLFDSGLLRDELQITTVGDRVILLDQLKRLRGGVPSTA